jgi:hypothetical protein
VGDAKVNTDVADLVVADSGHVIVYPFGKVTGGRCGRCGLPAEQATGFCTADEHDEVPTAVIFFPNGMAAVFNRAGHQIPKYQAGRHADVIAALKADGYDWRTMKTDGSPLQPSEFRDRLGNLIEV